MGNDKTNKISEFQDRVLNLVRFGDLLELGLGLPIIAILVWMPLVEKQPEPFKPLIRQGKFKVFGIIIQRNAGMNFNRRYKIF